jgi:hypothetical protein
MQLAYDIECAGTTPALLVAHAWQIAGRHFKGLLITALDSPDCRPRARRLLDDIVRSWAYGGGSSYRGEGGSSGGNIEREAFEFTATAYMSFADTPEEFGDWIKGSDVHNEAVKALRAPLQRAFEGVIPGKWSAPADGGVGLGGGGGSGGMSLELFDTLLRECRVALKLQQLLSSDESTNPLWCSDKSTRDTTLDLLRRTVIQRMPIVTRVANLATASVPLVERELAKIMKRR